VCSGIVIGGENSVRPDPGANGSRRAAGSRFVVRAHVVRAGKQQVFTSCELFAENDAGGELLATDETLLTVVKGEA
jgi:acyl-coenzyme A thioesterase PaaI-like protein